MSGVAPPIDFLFITALSQEREALLTHLEPFRRVAPDAEDDYVYYRATVPFAREDGEKGQYEAVVTTVLAENRVQAAIATTYAIRRWRPAHVILVGHAVGVGGQVARGDVLIADQIVDYEQQHLVGDQIRPSWQGYPVDPRLRLQVRDFRGGRWHVSPGRSRPGGGRPQRHMGPIASGDKVVASSQQITWITQTWQNLIGFETEAGGVIAAATQAPSRPRFFMVRGVADLHDTEQDDRWLVYACAVAASFAIAFLRSGPVNARPAEPTIATPAPPASGALPTSPALAAVPPAGHAIIISALTHTIEQQRAIIVDRVDLEIAALHEEAREGRWESVRERLAAFQNNQVFWDTMGVSGQARVLELLAQLDIDRGGDLAAVRRLVEEVRARDVSRAALLDALVAYHNGDPDAALATLRNRDDIEARHVQATALLTRGDASQSLTLLAAIVASGEPTAETFRLQALAHLARREVTAAMVSAAEATRLAPRWLAVRQISAVLAYWAAVSPLALQEGVVDWPFPPSWVLVKRDDASREGLATAAATFADLATRFADPAERREQRRWQLACLGNDAQRQEEASALCMAILRETPADPCALAWGLARDWPIDTAPSRALLETRVQEGSATTVEIANLVALDLRTDTPGRAAQLLDRAAIQKRFADADASDEWARLRAHAAAAMGDGHRAKVLTSENFSSPAALQARTVALLAAARERDDERDWVRLARHLDRSAADTGDPIFRLTRCEVLAERGRWAELAAEADWLVEEIGTADALRLAAIATFNAGQAERCRELLNEHLTLFPGARLPDDLRELLLIALRASGHLLAAIAMAEEFARESETEHNLVRLALLRGERADRHGVADVARRLATLSGLTGEALRVAEMAAVEDRAAAIAIVERVTSATLPPEQIPEAVYLAQRLGLRDRLDPLLAQLVSPDARERGIVRRLSEAEIRELLDDHELLLADLTGSYHRGEIPFHLLLDSPLQRYHAMLGEHADSPDPRRQQPLFVRHGGRPVAVEPRMGGEGRLVLDLTGLFLAAHLDLLAIVEETFAPLFLPPALPSALGTMRSQIPRSEPEELDLVRAILRLADAGRITLASIPDEPLAAAGQGEGIQITTISREGDTTGATLAGADVGAPPVAHPAAVVNALRRSGALAAADAARALAVLGGALESDPAPNWPRGTQLYCGRTTALMLARAGVLDPASRRFRVVIPAADLDALRATDERDRQAQTLDTWLADLQDRISGGLGETYELLPYPTESGNEEGVGAFPGNTGLPGLEQILLTELRSDDVVWVDDRFVSRYERTTAAAIVGIIDILTYLRDLERIDVARYHATLARLRAGNARFIPLTTDDLDYHLGLAGVDDGIQIETRELAVLRQYTAACLLAGADLQAPRPQQDTSASGFGEAEVVIGVRRTVADCLAAAWDDEEIERTEARAEWLLQALYLDALAALDIAGMTRPDHDRRALRALGLADLVSRAISFRDPATDAGRERRRRYLTWLNERLLAPQFAIDPALRTAVATLLGQLIDGLLDDAQALAGMERPVAALWASFFTDLPDDLQEALAADTALLRRLNLERRTAVVIGGLTFDAPAIEGALTAALAGRATALDARDPAVTIDCEPLTGQDCQPRCRLVRRDTGEVQFPEAGHLVLLLDTPEARAAGLRRFPSWFDCDPDRRERAIVAIAALPTAEERHAVVHRWRTRSGAEHFAVLARRVLEERAFRFDDLLPGSVENLPDRLRLGAHSAPETAFADALASGAHALLAEFEPVEAFARLAALPVALPASIVDALAAQEEPERMASLRRILRLAATPTLLAQAIRLLRHFGGDDRAMAMRVRRLIRRATGARGLAASAAFVAILEWVADELTARSEARGWSAPVRLAVTWSCADHLYRILHAAGAPDDFLRPAFRDKVTPPGAVLDWEATFALDVAHPQQARPLPLLAAACAYALEGIDAVDLPPDWGGRWANLTLPEVGGGVFPETSLLRNLAWADNSLDSWIARPWPTWLATPLDSARRMLASEAARERVEMAISRLADPQQDLEAWAELHFTLGPLSVDPALTGSLAAQICATDLADMVRRDEGLGRAALEVAGVQARALGDASVLQHMREQVLAIAEDSATSEATDPARESDEREVRLAQTLLLVALWLAQADGGAPEIVAARAAELMEEIFDRCPAVAVLARPTLLRWCLALPNDLSARFWRTLTRARSA